MGGVDDMVVGGSVVGVPTGVGEIGAGVLEGGFEPIETVVQAPQIAAGHDDVSGRQGQTGGAAASFEGPLAVGGGAVLAWTSLPRSEGDRALAPGAPRPFG